MPASRGVAVIEVIGNRPAGPRRLLSNRASGRGERDRSLAEEVDQQGLAPVVGLRPVHVRLTVEEEEEVLHAASRETLVAGLEDLAGERPLLLDDPGFVAQAGILGKNPPGKIGLVAEGSTPAWLAAPNAAPGDKDEFG